MTDGLDDLDRQRTARQRSARARNIPPSRHPAAEKPSDVDGQPEQQPTELVTPVPIKADPSAFAPAAKPAAAPVPVVNRRVANPTPTAGGELIRTTLHLSPAEDEFLEAVRSAGRGRRPRLDASRSAVARYAIAKLATQMTPEQIVTALEQPPQPTTSSGGRPRR